MRQAQYSLPVIETQVPWHFYSKAMAWAASSPSTSNTLRKQGAFYWFTFLNFLLVWRKHKDIVSMYSIQQREQLVCIYGQPTLHPSIHPSSAHLHIHPSIHPSNVRVESRSAVLQAAVSMNGIHFSLWCQPKSYSWNMLSDIRRGANAAYEVITRKISQRLYLLVWYSWCYCAAEIPLTPLFYLDE